MLAYVFWHWPSPTIEAYRYEEQFILFHRTLSAHKSNGFHHTRALLMEQASWLERNEATYEDWHLVENAAALEPLNEQTVSGPCQESHRQVARWTQGSAAGLYRLVFGDADLPAVYVAYRFQKPVGMTYGALYPLLQPLVQEGKGMLWTRYMNLGSGPEFYLQSSEQLVFPETLPTQEISVKQISFTLSQ
jgi:hypothetical protein